MKIYPFFITDNRSLWKRAYEIAICIPRYIITGKLHIGFFVEESNADVDRAGASDAGQAPTPPVAGSASNDLLGGAVDPGDELIESICEAAMNASLPEGFQWGHDAMEQFKLGKSRAYLAVRKAFYDWRNKYDMRCKCSKCGAVIDPPNAEVDRAGASDAGKAPTPPVAGSASNDLLGGGVNDQGNP